VDFPFISNESGPAGLFPVNLYLSRDSVTGEPCLKRAPGLVKRVEFGSGAPRGLVAWKNSWYAVVGTGLWKIDTEWNATQIGTLTTNSGLVSMAGGDTMLMVADSASPGLVYNVQTGTTTVPSGLDNLATLAYSDGYWVGAPDGSDFWYASANGDATSWSQLDEGLAGVRPDQIKELATNEGLVMAIGEETIEWYYNAGSATGLAFERLAGATQEVGTLSRWSSARLDKSVFWLDNHGRVLRTSGTSYTVVSTQYLEQRLTSLSWAGSIGSAFVWQGAPWYVLTLPAEGLTFVYDAAANYWWQWASGPVLPAAHKALAFARIGATVAALSRDDGVLYELRSDAYDDDGTVCRLERTCPPVYSEGKRIRHNRLELRMRTGLGEQGERDPLCMLEYTDDYMTTWSDPIVASMGAIGERDRIVFWDGLGISKHRIYRFSCTEAVPIEIYGAFLHGQVGMT